jgi:hypothetical protein
MPQAFVIYPEQKVHKTVLEEPPQRLTEYLENKLDLKQPVQRSELSNTLADIATNDEARFERLTKDIYKIYEDLYTRDGDSEGKISLEEYRKALFERDIRKEATGINPPTSPSDDLIEGDPKRKDKKKGNPKADNEEGNPETDKDQEIAIYQLAIGALALFLLISIAR